MSTSELNDIQVNVIDNPHLDPKELEIARLKQRLEFLEAKIRLSEELMDLSAIVSTNSGTLVGSPSKIVVIPDIGNGHSDALEGNFSSSDRALCAVEDNTTNMPSSTRSMVASTVKSRSTFDFNSSSRYGSLTASSNNSVPPIPSGWIVNISDEKLFTQTRFDEVRPSSQADAKFDVGGRAVRRHERSAKPRISNDHFFGDINVGDSNNNEEYKVSSSVNKLAGVSSSSVQAPTSQSSTTLTHPVLLIPPSVAPSKSGSTDRSVSEAKVASASVSQSSSEPITRVVMAVSKSTPRKSVSAKAVQSPTANGSRLTTTTVISAPLSDKRIRKPRTIFSPVHNPNNSKTYDDLVVVVPSHSAMEESKSTSKTYISWTDEMDSRLRQGYKTFGEKWSQVAAYVGHGATDEKCQYRWKYMQSGKYKTKNKRKYISSEDEEEDSSSSDDDSLDQKNRRRRSNTIKSSSRSREGNSSNVASNSGSSSSSSSRPGSSSSRASVGIRGGNSGNSREYKVIDKYYSCCNIWRSDGKKVDQNKVTDKHCNSDSFKSVFDANLKVIQSPDSSSDALMDSLVYMTRIIEGPKPPMKVIDSSKLLHSLCLFVLDVNIHADVLNQALTAIYYLANLEVGPDERVNEIVSDGLIPRLTELVATSSHFITVEKSICLLNCIARGPNAGEVFNVNLDYPTMSTLYKVVTPDSCIEVLFQGLKILMTFCGSKYCHYGLNDLVLLLELIHAGLKNSCAIVFDFAVQALISLIKLKNDPLKEFLMAGLTEDQGILHTVVGFINEMTKRKTKKSLCVEIFLACLETLRPKDRDAMLKNCNPLMGLISCISPLNYSGSADAVSFNACKCLSLLAPRCHDFCSHVKDQAKLEELMKDFYEWADKDDLVDFAKIILKCMNVAVVPRDDSSD